MAARRRAEVLRYEPTDGDDGYGYWRVLRTLWDSTGVVVNIETDVRAGGTHIDALLRCPNPACTFAYMLHRPSTGGADHYAQRVGPLPPAGGDWITAGAGWCDYTGIGICKLDPSVRVRPLERSFWRFLDIAVSRGINTRWHVHWPEVAHDHM